MTNQVKDNQDAKHLLELALAAMSRVEKVSISTSHIIRAYAPNSPKDSSMIVVKVEQDIDRSRKMAHMMIKEGYEHGSNLNEIYYVGDAQYVKTADGWRKSNVNADMQLSMFGPKGVFAIESLGALRAREFSIKPQDRENIVTLSTKISGQEVMNLAAVAKAASQGQGSEPGSVNDLEIEIDINRHTYLMEAFRIQSTGTSNNIATHLSLESTIRPLAASFSIKLPAEVMAAAPPAVAGIENLMLGSGAQAACWCTGCTACTACLACLVCISCLACLFPPLLAPVTAAAAGSAIAASVAIAVSASTGIATAIQKG